MLCLLSEPGWSRNKSRMSQPTCSHNLRKTGKAKLPLWSRKSWTWFNFKTCLPDRTLSLSLANKCRFAVILTYLGKRARNQIFICPRAREGILFEIWDLRFEIEDFSRRVRRHRKSLKKDRQSYSDAPYTIYKKYCYKKKWACCLNYRVRCVAVKLSIEYRYFSQSDAPYKYCPSLSLWRINVGLQRF